MDAQSAVFGAAIGVVSGYFLHILQTGYTDSRKANRVRRALAFEMADNFNKCLSQHVHHQWFFPFLRGKLLEFAFMTQPEYPLNDKDSASLRHLASVAPSSVVYDRIGEDLHFLTAKEVQAIRRHYNGVQQIREATLPPRGEMIGKNEAFRFVHGIRNVLFTRDTLRDLLHAAGADERFREIDGIFVAILGDDRTRIFQ